MNKEKLYEELQILTKEKLYESLQILTDARQNKEIPLLTKHLVGETVSTRVLLPKDCESVCEISVYVTEDFMRVLKLINKEEYFEIIKHAPYGVPSFYIIEDDRFLLYPLLNKDYKFSITYLALPPFYNKLYSKLTEIIGEY